MDLVLKSWKSEIRDTRQKKNGNKQKKISFMMDQQPHQENENPEVKADQPGSNCKHMQIYDMNDCQCQ